MIEEYINYIRLKLKEIMLNKNFYGSILLEINFKSGSITNINLSTKESVKI